MSFFRFENDERIELTEEEAALYFDAPSDIEPAPRLPHLEPDQFWFVVRATGHEEQLRSWVASLNDPASGHYNPVEWAQVSAKLDFAKHFERDHPLIEAARAVLDISAAELDALWDYGAGA